MCGRFALGIAIDQLPDKFNQSVLNPSGGHDLTKNSEKSYHTTTSAGPDGTENEVDINLTSLDYTGSFNIPPTAKAVILYMNKNNDGSQEYVFEPLSFGLVPNYEKPKDPAPVKRGDKHGPAYSRELQNEQLKRFNCRKETLSNNRSVWTEPRKNLRCVVPINGYYEWQKTKKEKPAYYLTLKDRPLLYLAGLYAHNYNYNDTEIVKEGQEFISSFTIVTGPAEGKGASDLLWLHERKPILLEPNTKEWFDWLTPTHEWDPKLLDTSLDHENNIAYNDTTTHEVDKAIGNPAVDGPDNIKPVKKNQRGIGLFFKPDNGNGGVKKEPKTEPKEEPKEEHESSAKQEPKEEPQDGPSKEPKAEVSKPKQESQPDEEKLQPEELDEDDDVPEDGVNDVDDIEDDEAFDEEDADDAEVADEDEDEAAINEEVDNDAEDVPDVKDEVEDIDDEGDDIEDEDVQAEAEELGVEEEEDDDAQTGSKRGKSGPASRTKRGKR